MDSDQIVRLFRLIAIITSRPTASLMSFILHAAHPQPLRHSNILQFLFIWLLVYYLISSATYILAASEVVLMERFE
jgi:hypothetical protein